MILRSFPVILTRELKQQQQEQQKIIQVEYQTRNEWVAHGPDGRTASAHSRFPGSRR